MKLEYTYEEIEDLIMSLPEEDLKFLEETIRERKKELKILPNTVFCLKTDNGKVWLDSYDELVSAFYAYICEKGRELSPIMNRLHYDIADDLQKEALKKPICFRYDYMGEYNGKSDVVMEMSIRPHNGDETYEVENVFPIEEDKELFEVFEEKQKILNKDINKVLVK